MKKVITLILSLAMLLTLWACNNAAPVTEPTTLPTETTEPEEFVTTTFVQNGASDFVIVHDGLSYSQELANVVRNAIFNAYGVKLEVKSASSTPETEKEIVIGNCRPITEKIVAKLTGEFDFMMKVEENKLVLCANHSLAYGFMGQYLKEEVLVKGDTEDLVLDSNDNLLYSKSQLMEHTYIDYVARKTDAYDLSRLFDWKTYENMRTTLPYRIYVPSNYTPEKEYPLLVTLHGAGVRGNDNVQHLLFIDNLLKMPELNMDDVIILFPQCPENEKWVDTDWTKGSYDLTKVPESNELKAVAELVAQLRQDYNIDSKRIYACGYSMGGYGTWNLLMNHPDVFCAGVAMCGAADPNQADILKDIPVWTIHGVLDPTVPVKGSQDMAQALEAVGAVDFHYTELPENEHDVWTYTYSNFEIFDWLLSRTK